MGRGFNWLDGGYFSGRGSFGGLGVAEMETGVAGRGSSAVFKATPSFAVNGCDTSWGRAFLLTTQVGVRLRFPGHGSINWD